MKIGSIRRENLKFLVACHGSQTAFANGMNHETLTQPIISSIIRGKRPFYDFEMRAVEEWLKIPEGWIKQYSLRNVWRHLRKLQNMDSDAVRSIHALIHVAKQN